MMISVQMDKREVFDKLWRWAKTYMAYPDYCLFDGKPYRRPNFDYNTDRYQYDAIRCAMNVGKVYFLSMLHVSGHFMRLHSAHLRHPEELLEHQQLRWLCKS
jgi:hypothetical protein